MNNLFFVFFVWFQAQSKSWWWLLWFPKSSSSSCMASRNWIITCGMTSAPAFDVIYWKTRNLVFYVCSWHKSVCNTGKSDFDSHCETGRAPILWGFCLNYCINDVTEKPAFSQICLLHNRSANTTSESGKLPPLKTALYISSPLSVPLSFTQKHSIYWLDALETVLASLGWIWPGIFFLLCQVASAASVATLMRQLSNNAAASIKIVT